MLTGMTSQLNARPPGTDSVTLQSKHLTIGIQLRKDAEVGAASSESRAPQPEPIRRWLFAS